MYVPLKVPENMVLYEELQSFPLIFGPEFKAKHYAARIGPVDYTIRTRSHLPGPISSMVILGLFTLGYTQRDWDYKIQFLSWEHYREFFDPEFSMSPELVFQVLQTVLDIRLEYGVGVFNLKNRVVRSIHCGKKRGIRMDEPITFTMDPDLFANWRSISLFIRYFKQVREIAKDGKAPGQMREFFKKLMAQDLAGEDFDPERDKRYN